MRNPRLRGGARGIVDGISPLAATTTQEPDRVAFGPRFLASQLVQYGNAIPRKGRQVVFGTDVSGAASSVSHRRFPDRYGAVLGEPVPPGGVNGFKRWVGEFEKLIRELFRGRMAAPAFYGRPQLDPIEYLKQPMARGIAGVARGGSWQGSFPLPTLRRPPGQ